MEGKMTREVAERYRDQLRDMADRLQGTVGSLEENTRVPAGGQSVGNLSNVPMHLGDLGTEVYQQELNSTLLENEEFLLAEVNAALDRLDLGTLGRCESCGQEIAKGRLDALPYSRFCAPCAARLQEGAGAPVNLDSGRPQQGKVDLLRDRPEAGGRSTNRAAYVDMEDLANAEDHHATGSAGGGTAVGGLGGTNVNEGSPRNADLEEAAGSGPGESEVETETEIEIEEAEESGASLDEDSDSPAGG